MRPTRAIPTLAALLAALLAAPAAAGDTYRIVATGWTSTDAAVSWSESETVWTDEGGEDTGAYDDADASLSPAIAVAGPFRLVAADTVEMAGTVDADSPRQFAALIAAHPGVRRLVMVDCPGSVNEDANHALARAVRRAGLETVVPPGGSVRSGAVDLFLAGVRRRAAPSAEFGVHSWRDEDGLEARDLPADDPVHAGYIAYYREMGMDDAAARRFYALTNSVGFDDVRYLGARDMARLGLAEVAG